MKQYVWNKTGMKQIINSGWKEFDKQTNLISTGNVISNTQYSSYIRPHSEVFNYGYTCNPGDFLKFDMQCFDRIPYRIRDILEDKGREKSMILYEFFVYSNGRKKVFAHVLTDADHNYITKEIRWEWHESISKRRDAVEEAMCYICN